jgi:hypothetical protein
VGPVLPSVDPERFPWELFASIGDALALTISSAETPTQVWTSLAHMELLLIGWQVVFPKFVALFHEDLDAQPPV